jgi:uncharacterized protein involved in exopolysaccharide biosynthesis
MKENQEYPLYEDEIDLRALLETLWRRRKFIFVFTLLTTLLTLGISLFLPRQYTASAFVLVNNPTNPNNLVNNPSSVSHVCCW